MTTLLLAAKGIGPLAIPDFRFAPCAAPAWVGEYPLKSERAAQAGFGLASGRQPEDLVALVARGDAAAFADLYRQYGGTAYAIALRIVRAPERAEDCVQEAFLRVWRSADRFDASRGAFTTWFLRIVHNLAIDAVRRDRRLVAAGAGPDLAAWAGHASSHEQAVTDRVTVAAVFERLSEEQRAVLSLAYFEGYKVREIAQALAVPEGTVKSRMRLGLAHMREQLRTGAGQ